MLDADPIKRLHDCPSEILVLVASALTATPKSLLAFGTAARSLKELVVFGDEASVLWDAASSSQLGPAASSLARRSTGSDEICGVGIYRAALRLRAAVADCVEIVEGSVTANAAGMDVVACPCLESLQNFGIGAQGVVRHAAGPSFEAGLDSLEAPLEPLSTTLVEGGSLAPALIAMVVTTPPRELVEAAYAHRLQNTATWQVAVSKRLHSNLFAAVR